MRLYHYFRSSSAYRVRIALNLKNISCEQVPISLLSSEQTSPEYLHKNPQGLVPALETESGILGQSLAIMEWLEATYPEVPLLPGNTWQQAQIRALACAISCDIQPLNNLRVLKYLTGELGLDDKAKNTWYCHWINTGFTAIEKQLGNDLFCIGQQPTLADVCLIPQVFNALRFDVDMEPFPQIMAIYHHCNTLSAFERAKPENQPDCGV